MQPPESKHITREHIVALWHCVAAARGAKDDLEGAFQANENAWAVQQAAAHDAYTFHRPVGYGSVMR